MLHSGFEIFIWSTAENCEFSRFFFLLRKKNIISLCSVDSTTHIVGVFQFSICTYLSLSFLQLYQKPPSSLPYIRGLPHPPLAPNLLFKASAVCKREQTF